MAVIGDIFKHQLKALEDERQKIAQDMLSGKMSSYEHYKQMVGRAEGIARSQQIIKDTIKRVHEEEE